MLGIKAYRLNFTIVQTRLAYIDQTILILHGHFNVCYMVRLGLCRSEQFRCYTKTIKINKLQVIWEIDYGVIVVKTILHSRYGFWNNLYGEKPTSKSRVEGASLHSRT